MVSVGRNPRAQVAVLLVLLTVHITTVASTSCAGTTVTSANTWKTTYVDAGCTQITGTLRLNIRDSTTLVAAPLVVQTGAIQIDLGSAFLTHFDALPNVHTATWIYVKDQNTLLSFSLPKLRFLTSKNGNTNALAIFTCPVLQTINLPLLEESPFWIAFSGLTTLSTLNIANAVPRGYSSVGALSMNGMPALTTWNTDNFKNSSMSRLYVVNLGITTLTGMDFTHLEILDIRSNSVLEVVENNNWPATIRYLRVESNPELQTADLAGKIVGGDSMQISGNPKLTTVAGWFDELIAAHGFYFGTNNLVPSLVCPKLEAITGKIGNQAMRVHNNPLLAEIRLPKLQTTTGNHFLIDGGHPVLSAVDLGSTASPPFSLISSSTVISFSNLPALTVWTPGSLFNASVSHLYLSGTGLEDLSNLQLLQDPNIKTNLLVSNSQLTDFTTLPAGTSFSQLNINSNSKLTSLAGLKVHGEPQISAAIQVHSNPELVSLSDTFDDLVQAQYVRIIVNPKLPSISFPKLEVLTGVTGNDGPFRCDQNAALKTLSIPKFRLYTGPAANFMRINGGLTSMDVASTASTPLEASGLHVYALANPLTSWGNNFYNASIANFYLSDYQGASLSTLNLRMTGTFYIRNCDNLLNLDGVQTGSPNAVDIALNDKLENLHGFTTDSNGAGSAGFYIHNNPVLTSLGNGFDTLENVRWLVITYNPLLEVISFPNLRTVPSFSGSECIDTRNNDKLHTISLPKLETVTCGSTRNLRFGGPLLVNLDVATSGANPLTTTRVFISDMPLLSSWPSTFLPDATVTYLQINGMSYVNMTMENLKITTGEFAVFNSKILNLLGSKVVANVLNIQGNTHLEELAYPGDWQATTLFIQSNSLLKEIPDVIKPDATSMGYISVSQNPELRGTIRIHDGITAISGGKKIGTPTYSVHIDANPKLEGLHMPSVGSMPQRFHVSNNYELTYLNVSSYTVAGFTAVRVDVIGSPKLETLGRSFIKVASVTQGFTIKDCGISYFGIELFMSANTLTLQNLPELRSVRLHTTDNFFYTIAINNCPELRSFSMPDAVAMLKPMTTVDTPILCCNDLSSLVNAPSNPSCSSDAEYCTECGAGFLGSQCWPCPCEFGECTTVLRSADAVNPKCDASLAPAHNVTFVRGRREATVNWEVPRVVGRSPLASYRVEWRPDGAGLFQNSPGGPVSADTYTDILTGLSPGSPYNVRIHVFNEVGFNGTTNVSTVVTQPIPGALEDVQVLAASVEAGVITDYTVEFTIPYKLPGNDNVIIRLPNTFEWQSPYDVEDGDSGNTLGFQSSVASSIASTHGALASTYPGARVVKLTSGPSTTANRYSIKLKNVRNSVSLGPPAEAWTALTMYQRTSVEDAGSAASAAITGKSCAGGTVSTEAAWESNYALEGCTAITGDLTLSITGTTSVRTSAIISISGNLIIQGTSLVNLNIFPELKSAKSIVIDSNSAMTQVSFPKLESVENNGADMSFVITGAAALTSISAPKLSSIDGGQVIISGTNIASLNVASTATSIDMKNKPITLSDINPTFNTWPSNSFKGAGNTSLTLQNVAGLRSLNGLVLREVTQLEIVNCDNLLNANGVSITSLTHLHVADSAKLTTLAGIGNGVLSSTAQVTVFLSNNPLLANLGSILTPITRATTIVIAGNKGPSVSVPNLREVSSTVTYAAVPCSIYIQDTLTPTVSSPKLESIASDVYILGGAPLTTLSLATAATSSALNGNNAAIHLQGLTGIPAWPTDSLKDADQLSLVISSSGFTTFTGMTLQRVALFHVESCPSLTNFAGVTIDSIVSLALKSNDDLTTLEHLGSVMHSTLSSSVELRGNAVLVNWGSICDQVTEMRYLVALGNNLANITLPLVTTITAQSPAEDLADIALWIEDASLATLVAHKLVDTRGAFTLFAPKLFDFSVSKGQNTAYDNHGHAFNISGVEKLSEWPPGVLPNARDLTLIVERTFFIDLGHLKLATVLDVMILGNPRLASLSSLDLPAPRSIHIEGNPLLASMPDVLNSVTTLTYLVLSYNPRIFYIDLPKLTGVTSATPHGLSISVEANSQLIHFKAPAVQNCGSIRIVNNPFMKEAHVGFSTYAGLDMRAGTNVRLENLPRLKTVDDIVGNTTRVPSIIMKNLPKVRTLEVNTNFATDYSIEDCNGLEIVRFQKTTAVGTVTMSNLNKLETIQAPDTTSITSISTVNCPKLCCDDLTALPGNPVAVGQCSGDGAAACTHCPYDFYGEDCTRCGCPYGTCQENNRTLIASTIECSCQVRPPSELNEAERSCYGFAFTWELPTELCLYKPTDASYTYQLYTQPKGSPNAALTFYDSYNISGFRDYHVKPDPDVNFIGKFSTVLNDGNFSTTEAEVIGSVIKIVTPAGPLTSVLPKKGPTNGGTILQIDGSNLMACYDIAIGGQTCQPTVWKNAGEIECHTPPGVGTGLNVTLMNGPDVLQELSTTFTYNAPTITAVEPVFSVTTGPRATIRGTNFGPPGITVPGIALGGTNAPIVSHLSHEYVVVDFPPGVGTEIDVTLTAGGQVATSAKVYTYLPPEVTQITHPSPLAVGGYVLSLSGRHFGPDNGLINRVIKVGGTVCDSPTSVSDSVLTCTVPHGVGPNRAVTLTIDGRNTVGPDLLFTYLPPTVSSIEPDHIPAVGATVTIHGVNFGVLETDGVTIGGTECKITTGWVSDSFVTCAGPTGVGPNRRVVMTSGTQPSTQAVDLTYDSPVVTSLGLPKLEPRGEQILTVHGVNFGTFDASPVIQIGGTSCNPTTYETDNILTCRTPYGAGLDRPLLVNVSSLRGHSNISYFEPIVTSVAPISGPKTGGNVVVVSGYHFGHADAFTQIFMGDSECIEVKAVQNFTKFSCTAGPNVGRQEVKVFTDYQNSTGNKHGGGQLAPPEYTFVDQAAEACRPGNKETPMLKELREKTNLEFFKNAAQRDNVTYSATANSVQLDYLPDLSIRDNDRCCAVNNVTKGFKCGIQFKPDFGIVRFNMKLPVKVFANNIVTSWPTPCSEEPRDSYKLFFRDSTTGQMLEFLTQLTGTDQPCNVVPADRGSISICSVYFQPIVTDEFAIQFNNLLFDGAGWMNEFEVHGIYLDEPYLVNSTFERVTIASDYNVTIPYVEVFTENIQGLVLGEVDKVTKLVTSLIEGLIDIPVPTPVVDGQANVTNITVRTPRKGIYTMTISALDLHPVTVKVEIVPGIPRRVIRVAGLGRVTRQTDVWVNIPDITFAAIDAGENKVEDYAGTMLNMTDSRGSLQGPLRVPLDGNGTAEWSNITFFRPTSGVTFTVVVALEGHPGVMPLTIEAVITQGPPEGLRVTTRSTETDLASSTKTLLPRLVVDFVDAGGTPTPLPVEGSANSTLFVTASAADGKPVIFKGTLSAQHDPGNPAVFDNLYFERPRATLHTITFNYEGLTSVSRTFGVVPGPPSALQVQAAPASVTCQERSPLVVTVCVVDAGGNIVPSYANPGAHIVASAATLSLATTKEFFTGSTCKTMNGLYAARPKVGDHTVRLSISDLSLDGTVFPATVTFGLPTAFDLGEAKLLEGFRAHHRFALPKLSPRLIDVGQNSVTNGSISANISLAFGGFADPTVRDARHLIVDVTTKAFTDGPDVTLDNVIIDAQRPGRYYVDVISSPGGFQSRAYILNVIPNIAQRIKVLQNPGGEVNNNGPLQVQPVLQLTDNYGNHVSDDKIRVRAQIVHIAIANKAKQRVMRKLEQEYRPQEIPYAHVDHIPHVKHLTQVDTNTSANTTAPSLAPLRVLNDVAESKGGVVQFTGLSFLGRRGESFTFIFEGMNMNLSSLVAPSNVIVRACAENSAISALGVSCDCAPGYTQLLSDEVNDGKSCLTCPRGTFKDSTGNSACSLCPANQNAAAGATGRGNCTCETGYFRVNPQPGDPCIPCLEEATCFGEDSIVARPGYWRSSPDSLKFYECIDERQCLGAKNTTVEECAQGSTGTLCTVCIHGYGRIQGLCEVCPSERVVVFILVANGLAIVFIVLFLIRSGVKAGRVILNSKDTKKETWDVGSIYMRIFLNYIQMLGLFASLKATSSSSVSGMTDGSSLLSLSLRTFAVDCAITSDYYNLYYAHLVYMPLLCMVAMFIWGIVLVSRRYTVDKLKDASWPAFFQDYGNKVIMTGLVIATTTYPVVSREAITSLACRYIDDSFHLISYPSEKCFNSQHYPAFFAGLIFISVFSLGFPIVLGRMIHLRAKAGTLQDESFVRRYAIVFRGYKTERAWWESIVSLRKFFLALIVIGLSTKAKLQLVIANLFLFLSIVTHVWFDPYESRTATNVEMISLSTLFLTLTGILTMEYVADTNALVVVINIFVILVNLIVAAFIFILVIQHHPLVKKLRKLLAKFVPCISDPEEAVLGEAEMYKLELEPRPFATMNGVRALLDRPDSRSSTPSDLTDDLFRSRPTSRALGTESATQLPRLPPMTDEQVASHAKNMRMLAQSMGDINIALRTSRAVTPAGSSKDLNRDSTMFGAESTHGADLSDSTRVSDAPARTVNVLPGPLLDTEVPDFLLDVIEQAEEDRRKTHAAKPWIQAQRQDSMPRLTRVDSKMAGMKPPPPLPDLLSRSSSLASVPGSQPQSKQPSPQQSPPPVGAFDDGDIEEDPVFMTKK